MKCSGFVLLSAAFYSPPVLFCFVLFFVCFFFFLQCIYFCVLFYHLISKHDNYFRRLEKERRLLEAGPLIEGGAC